MKNLSTQAQSILDAGRDLDNPSDIDRVRATRAVLARVAAAGAAVAVTTSATAAAVPLLKIVGPLLVVVAGSVGGGLWWRAHVQSTPAAVTAPAPVLAPTAAPPPAEPEVITSAPKASPRPRPKPAARHLHAVAAPGQSLQQETALLAQANAALRDGDAAASLVLLDLYRQRFPNGTLREETLATRIIARCRLEPGPRTREAAQRFLQQHPATPLGPRLQSSCLSTMSR